MECHGVLNRIKECLLSRISLHSIFVMSSYWTKEQAEAFLETKPDSVFPCSTDAALRSALSGITHWSHAPNKKEPYAPVVMDALDRCESQCANCNQRVLFKRLNDAMTKCETSIKKLDLDLDEALQQLHWVNVEFAQIKNLRQEEKRRLSGAIAKMVEVELSDVRAQLSDVRAQLSAKAARSEALIYALMSIIFLLVLILMF